MLDVIGNPCTTLTLEVRDPRGMISTYQIAENSYDMDAFKLGCLMRQLLLAVGYPAQTVDDIISEDVYNAL
jgi:hypothetical protein